MDETDMGKQVVYSGRIGVPDGTPDGTEVALRAAITIDGNEVSVSTADESLGTWEISAVVVERYRSDFYLVTLGTDQILFRLDDLTLGESFVSAMRSEETVADRIRRLSLDSAGQDRLMSAEPEPPDIDVTLRPKGDRNTATGGGTRGEDKNKSSGIGCLALLGILAALALFGVCSDSGTGGGSTPRADTGEAVGAWVICQQFLEDRLKAPGTAEYPSGYSQYTTSLGGGKFKIDAYVDAQNSFGAQIRTDFTCSVSYTGNDNWRLDNLTMDE